MIKTHAIPTKAKELPIRGLSRTPISKTVFTAFLALTLFSAGYAQSIDTSKLDQFFDRLAEKKKAMGSLVITKDGKVLYTRTIGYSQINGTEKKPLTAETRYRVGSVTKMFTAVMILQLAEEGKLKLSDHLDKFYPQIPNAGKIEIAHILAHRSGIHDISEDRDFRARRLDGMTKDELFALMVKSKPDFEPGEKYAYSNTGFQLLGMLIEKLTGKSYQEVLKERITSKIGLKDTYMATGNIDPTKNESFSYRYLLDWEQQPDTHASLLFGSGAAVSTPADLARFIQALFDGRLVSQKSLAQMLTVKDGYGFGMDTFTFDGKTFYGHTGGIDGFGSWLAYLPEEKLVLSYAANGKVFPVAKIMDAIVTLYDKKPFQIPTFESIAVSPEVLDKYVGVYSIPGTPVKFTVSREGTTLYIQMAGQSPIPLEPMAQNTFGIESAGIVFEFDTSKNQMTQKRSGRERVLTKEK